LDAIAETPFEEESAVVSKPDRCKSPNTLLSGVECSNCGKVGHTASKCYLKQGKDVRVKKFLKRPYLELKKHFAIILD
jgi:hypothetical protein